MRCDLPRIPRNARSLLCATKASATDQSTLSPRPDGTTRLPSRRPRALHGGGSSSDKDCSSEITARDSLRPRVVKSQPVIKRTRLPHRRRRPPSAAGWVAIPLCKTVARQAIEPSQLPGVLPLAIDADGWTLGGTGAPFLRQWVQPHRPDARTSTTSHCQQLL